MKADDLKKFQEVTKTLSFKSPVAKNIEGVVTETIKRKERIRKRQRTKPTVTGAIPLNLGPFGVHSIKVGGKGEDISFKGIDFFKLGKPTGPNEVIIPMTPLGPVKPVATPDVTDFWINRINKIIKIKQYPSTKLINITPPTLPALPSLPSMGDLLGLPKDLGKWLLIGGGLLIAILVLPKLAGGKK